MELNGIEGMDYSYNYKVLQETVADDDLFEDKTHKTVSENLHRLIETAESAVTIGLEGGWGSGKSTVINLLRSNLSAQKGDKTLFYIFDAWSHDGDPLRRIFLEGLIDNIDPKEADTELQKTKFDISNRTKNVDIKTQKKGSTLAKRLSTSALLVPPGTALMLTAVKNSDLLLPWQVGASEVNWLFLFGLLFAFSPLLYLAFWYFFGEKDKSGKLKWEMFESESTETYTQNITEENERTSIEFERYFKEIANNFIGEEKTYSRAIIVIDNLDRVSSSQARNIWGTLQTFFQHRSSSEKNNLWLKNLWFVIPYDREGFSRLWQADQYQEADIAQSFLNKCFQVIAEVPQPVMTGWIRYLSESAEKTLFGWPENEVQAVINTYKSYFSRLDESPTPRHIHVFLNQVGIVGMRWAGEMSPESIAMYAILRYENSERTLRRLLLDREIPNIGEINANEFLIYQELSGMLFGVKKEKGTQLLLGPEINQALRNGDGVSLRSLIDTHSEAFWVAWTAIKDSVFPTSSHTEEYRIAFLAAVHEGMNDKLDRIFHERKLILQDWMAPDKKLDFGSFDYLIPAQQLYDLADEKDSFLTWLFELVKGSINFSVKFFGKDEFQKDSLTRKVILVQFLRDHGKDLPACTYPTLTADNWGNWLDTLNELKIKVPYILPAKGTIGSIWDKSIEDPNNPDPFLIMDLKRSVGLMPSQTGWDHVVSGLVTWLQSPQRGMGNGSVYELILEMLSRLSSKLTQPLRKGIRESTFLQTSASEDINTIKSLPLIYGVVFTSEIQENSEVPESIKDYWSNYDDDKIDFVSKKLSFYKFECCLWDISRDSSNALAIEIIRASKSSKLFSCSDSIAYIDELEWLDGKERQNILEKLISAGAYKAVKSHIKDNPEEYEKVLYILQSSGNNEITDFVDQVIKKISKELWRKNLSGRGYLVRCLNRENKNHNFTDAFSEYIIQGMGGEDVSAMVWKHFDVLIEFVQDKSIHAREFTKAYFGADKDMLDDVAFNTISKHMHPYIRFISDENVMKRLNNWIDDEQLDRLDWTLSSDKVFESKPLESLESRILAKLSSRDESGDIWRRLADRLEIKLEMDQDKEPKDD